METRGHRDAKIWRHEHSEIPHPSMPFTYPRTIHFHETDAAGVVYFANGLTLCHEAYEASLAAVGIALGEFFAVTERAYPIVHARIDFRRPLACGDQVLILVTPLAISDTSYEVTYEIQSDKIRSDPTAERPLASALTRHVCIEVSTRSRAVLPASIQQWLRRWGVQSD